MNKIIKKSLQSLLLVPALALGASAVVPVLESVPAAAQCDSNAGINAGINCAIGDNKKTDIFGDGGIFQTVVNVFLFIIGAVSVIMIIYGGFKYVTSGGDSSGVTSAKNTILYAIIGLIIALLAYGILNFVIKNLTGTAV